MSSQSHWQKVYEGKSPDQQSWYQARPDISLEWIGRVAHETPTRLVDVGGGASTLVDHLVAREGFQVTVADIAAPALKTSRQRLGERAEQVEWVVADLTEPVDFDGSFDIWHDRAVFHFLTDEKDRRVYRDNLERHVAPNGHAIIATFGPEGPDKCSGLPVRRYSAKSLARTLGDGWKLLESQDELHTTPWDGEQAFVYALFERVG